MVPLFVSSANLLLTMRNVNLRVPRHLHCRVCTTIDWPPMEFFAPAKIILGAMFVIPGVARKAYQDLTRADALYRSTPEDTIDYLLVRPVGLGDEVEPVGTWQLQKQKGVDTVGGDMAKLDCARFMVQEALEATLHRTAVVIGSVEDKDTATSTEESKQDL